MEKKFKLVMIDDEADLCTLVKKNLEDTGEFDVVTSSNPLDAEKVIRREKPDLVMLDMVMPQRRGDDVLVGIKKDAALKNIPIILVSGRGEMVFNKEKNAFKWMPNNPLAREQGEMPNVRGTDGLRKAYDVEDYVSKPFETAILAKIIKEILSRRRKAV